ncbi:hypothetical protein B0T18DRAFT_37166 [Schizothecium vesticola]|uniref:Uncharacterized protein n=1 Tax=Schizothecium vesticola TaxID=314040 RepID=A0AA40FBV2_9PEZI|nr:hypothetical protein B0T18DRAFT_37166 [Schizothecium vesticola]
MPARLGRTTFCRVSTRSDYISASSYLARPSIGHRTSTRSRPWQPRRESSSRRYSRSFLWTNLLCAGTNLFARFLCVACMRSLPVRERLDRPPPERTVTSWVRVEPLRREDKSFEPSTGAASCLLYPFSSSQPVPPGLRGPLSHTRAPGLSPLRCPRHPDQPELTGRKASSTPIGPPLRGRWSGCGHRKRSFHQRNGSPSSPRAPPTISCCANTNPVSGIRQGPSHTGARRTGDTH